MCKTAELREKKFRHNCKRFLRTKTVPAYYFPVLSSNPSKDNKGINAQIPMLLQQRRIYSAQSWMEGRTLAASHHC